MTPAQCRQRFAAALMGAALGAYSASPAAAVTITVDPPPDTPLTYSSALTTLPDEHLTFIPAPPSALNGDQYTVFGASAVIGQAGGAVLLQTTQHDNYRSFSLPPERPATLMSAPVAFGQCNPTYDSEFDENYVGPGSVFQDPSRPAGNYIMIYEAENHCPGGSNQFAYFATIGFARSDDYGLTWPKPGAARRRPILAIPTSEPTAVGSPAMGDAIPSAFVTPTHIYVVYRDVPQPNANPPPVSPGNRPGGPGWPRQSHPSQQWLRRWRL
jgi:hypothetical protein